MIACKIHSVDHYAGRCLNGGIRIAPTQHGFPSAYLQFNGNACEGQVAIQIPDRKQRYEAPAFSCALSAGHLSFSVITLPLPFLFDRFVGTLVGDRLVGTVERQGRELTNSMSGVWNLGRQAARN
jgi:hypothetical protein